MTDETPRVVGRYKIVNFPTTATFMAMGMLVLLAAIVLLLFTKEVPKENVAPLNIVIGAIIGSVGTVIAFYFGDSKKSAQQQDTISVLAARPPDGTGGGIVADKNLKAADKQIEAADKQLDAADKV